MRMYSGIHPARHCVALLVLLSGCNNTLQPSSQDLQSTFDYSTLPRRISQLSLGFWTAGDKMQVEGTLAVVAAGDRVAIIDRTHRLVPQKLSETRWNGVVRGVGLLDSRVFLLESNRLSVLPAQDLEDTELGELPLPDTEFAYFMRVLAGSCWIAVQRGQSHALYRVDVQDSSNPRIQSQAPIGGPINDIAIEGNLLLVGTHDGTVFLDISTPDELETILTIGLGEYVAMGNGYAYVSGTEYGITRPGVTALDIRDPRHPIQVGSILTPRSAHPMRLMGRYLFVASSVSTDVLDMIDRRRPAVAGNLPVGNIQLGEGVFWSAAAGEFQEFEFGMAFSPPRRAERGVYGWWSDFVQLQDQCIYWQVSDGLRSIRTDDPLLSGPVQEYPFGDALFGRRIEVNRDRVISSREDFVDIHGLYTAQLAAHLTLEGGVRWHGSKEDALFVLVSNIADGSHDLVSFDISSRNPRLLDRLPGEFLAQIRQVQLDGDHILVLSSTLLNTFGLDIIGIGPAGRLRKLSHLETPGADVMSAAQDRVYLQGEQLTTVDITDPQQPRILSTQSGHGAIRLVVSGRTLYSTDRYEMVVHELSANGIPRKVGVTGWVSNNPCYGLLADDRSLYALLSNGIYAYPHHAPGSGGSSSR